MGHPAFFNFFFGRVYETKKCGLQAAVSRQQLVTEQVKERTG
jgi:hypothetical protein